MNTAGAVVLAIVLLLIAGVIGWVVFTRIRASRLGLPPPPLKSYLPCLPSSRSGSSSSAYAGPAPAPGGLVGWFNDRIRAFRYRNNRTAAGAYEGPGGASSTYNAGYASAASPHHQTRGGAFDHDDDAWDARVGAYHPYEEERELGIVVPPHGHGGGAGLGVSGEGYQMNLPVSAGPREEEDEEPSRGRTRSRSPGPAPQARANPFGDDAEPSNISLRGVSPRPMEASTATTSFAGRKVAAAGEGHHDDRRSIFREEM